MISFDIMFRSVRNRPSLSISTCLSMYETDLVMWYYFLQVHTIDIYDQHGHQILGLLRERTSSI